jgi:hypothetical protein
MNESPQKIHLKTFNVSLFDEKMPTSPSQKPVPRGTDIEIPLTDVNLDITQMNLSILFSNRS